MRPTLDVEELATFAREQNFVHLQADIAYNQVLMLLKEAVSKAEHEMQTNANPRMDSYYLNRWRERKNMLDFLLQYVQAIVDNRADRIVDKLRELGFTDEEIARYKDADFSVLEKVIGGPNGNTSTSNQHR